MHPGSKRVVMSLFQNYMLRNTIDRTLRGSLTASYAQPGRGVFTTMLVKNGQGGSSNNKNFNTSSTAQADAERSQNDSSLPHEPPLDQESLSKLNQLKEAIKSKNEYFDKYKDKLRKIETTSPRELLARLEQLDDQKKDQKKRHQTAEQVAKKPKSLNDVMHIDSIKNLERDDIIHLWQEFHRHKEGLLGAVMAGSVYERMSDLASVHKLFVMPLPRTDGYEFFFMQFENNTFHFTPLILYQTHKESAPVALRLINYTDLKNDKDLVLLRGEYDHKCMKAEDAHFLAVQTNFYYGETNESRLSILEKFTKKPDEFKHMELIDELKRIQETHAQLFEFEPTNIQSSDQK